jgi:DNA processing protein
LEGDGLSGAIAQSIASGCTFEDAAAQQEKMTACGAELVTIYDPRYPQALRDIFDAPCPRARGAVANALPGGSGHAPPYALRGWPSPNGWRGDLAHAGLTVASGMARGIDTAAHKGTLAVGGATIAVLGCGVDVIYPSEKRRLWPGRSRQGADRLGTPYGGGCIFPRTFRSGTASSAAWAWVF